MIVGRWITNASILRQRLEYLHCLKKFTKITRDFQRFRRLVVCVQAITHYHPNFRSFLLKAVILKQYCHLKELDRISDSVTVSAPKRSKFFVSDNFDIAVSYICTLGTVSVRS